MFDQIKYLTILWPKLIQKSNHDNTHLLSGYYWIDQKVYMVLSMKIKHTFFIVTSNFIDLDILSITAISYMV